MSDNPTFVQALADATGRPVEVSRRTRGHHARRRPTSPAWPPGMWSSFDEIADGLAPAGGRRARRTGSTASGGPTRCRPGREDGYRTCPRSTSRVAPLAPGKEGWEVFVRKDLPAWTSKAPRPSRPARNRR